MEMPQLLDYINKKIDSNGEVTASFKEQFNTLVQSRLSSQLPLLTDNETITLVDLIFDHLDDLEQKALSAPKFFADAWSPDKERLLDNSITEAQQDCVSFFEQTDQKIKDAIHLAAIMRAVNQGEPLPKELETPFAKKIALGKGTYESYFLSVEFLSGLKAGWANLKNIAVIDKFVFILISAFDVVYQLGSLAIDVYRSQKGRDSFSYSELKKAFSRDKIINTVQSIGISLTALVLLFLAFYVFAAAAPMFLLAISGVGIVAGVFNFIKFELNLNAAKKLDTLAKENQAFLEKISDEMSRVAELLKAQLDLGEQQDPAETKRLITRMYQLQEDYLLRLADQQLLTDKISEAKDLIQFKSLARANLSAGLVLGAIVLIGVVILAFPPFGLAAATATLIGAGLMAGGAALGVGFAIFSNRYRAHKIKQQLKAKAKKEQAHKAKSNIADPTLGSEEKHSLGVTTTAIAYTELTGSPEKAIQAAGREIQNSEHYNRFQYLLKTAMVQKDFHQMCEVTSTIATQNKPILLNLIIEDKRVLKFLKKSLLVLSESETQTSEVNPNRFPEIFSNDTLSAALLKQGLKLQPKAEAETKSETEVERQSAALKKPLEEMEADDEEGSEGESP
jgi:hypothetical protein